MTDRAMKLVILDFDGTIADTQSLITKTMLQTIETLGLESRTPEECARMIGLPLKETFTRLIPMSDEMGNMCEATYRRLFDRNNTEGAVSLYPKVRETIEHLHCKGVAVSIASSRERKSLDRYVDMFGLRPFIDLVIGADNVHHAKPHPEPVLLTLNMLDLNASEALVVGDTAYDIEMGKRAGCRTCGVSYGNGSVEELRNAGADYIIDRFEMLKVESLEFNV